MSAATTNNALRVSLADSLPFLYRKEFITITINTTTFCSAYPTITIFTPNTTSSLQYSPYPTIITILYQNIRNVQCRQPLHISDIYLYSPPQGTLVVHHQLQALQKSNITTLTQLKQDFFKRDYIYTYILMNHHTVYCLVATVLPSSS